MVSEVDVYKFALKEEKELCRSYRYFFRKAWPILEPGNPLCWNWHLDYLCDICEHEAKRIAAGKDKKKDIIVNICPRSLKSYTFGILFNAWVWTMWPGQKFITGSYDQSLALFHATETRRLITDSWYQERWGDVFALSRDQNEKSFFQNDKRGLRKAVQTGTGTGYGGDYTIFDDPLNAEQAESPVYRMRAIRWLTKTMATRLNQPHIGLRIIVMQRLHEEDPTGYMLTDQPDAWHHICIPAIEDDNIQPKSLRKKYKNGLFFPARFSNEVLLDWKHRLKSSFAGQMQQKPSPDEGDVFKKVWFRFWVPAGVSVPNHVIKDANNKPHTCPQVELPETFDKSIQSWDMAIKEKEHNSAVAGHLWSIKGPHMFLRDRVWDHMGFIKSVKALRDLSKKYPEAHGKLVENKANGSPVIEYLKEEIPGIIPVEPTGSKTERATKADLSGSSPLAARMEAGNVWWPHPALFPWMDDVMQHFTLFPNGKFADDIDAASQAAHHFGTVRHVWPQFDLSSVVPISIKWDNTESSPNLHYAAIVMQPDMSVWVLAGLWDAVPGRLYLYYCWNDPEPSMDVLSAHLVRVLQMRKYRMEKLLCNAEMFASKPSIKSPASILRKEIKKRAAHHTVAKPRMHDLYGSISIGRELMKQHRLYVDARRCQGAATQFSNWVFNKGQPDTNSGYCTALCLILSELKKRLQLQKILQFADYK